MRNQSAPSRLRGLFTDARAADRSLLIPFVVAGDPDAARSAEVLDALGEAGADLVEIGVPYSDPLADGPSIVAASQRALDSGACLQTALDLVRGCRTPSIIFTYANPVIQFGIERLARELAAADGFGAIIPDLPLEESVAIADIFARYDLELPLLIAPTTKPERSRRIAAASSGFLYVVARLGVTGAASVLAVDGIRRQVEELRSMTDLPVAVGFGISTPAHVAAIAGFADGAIVGSALVDAIARVAPEGAARAAADFLRPLRFATGHARPQD